MLIEIVNLDPKTLDPVADFEKVDALENLLKAHGSRHHLLLASKATLLSIIDGKSPLGGTSRVYAQDALELRQETRGLIHNILIHLVVDFANATQSTSVTMNGQLNIVTCGYRLFGLTSRCEPTGLLTENEDDFDIYLKIAEMYAKHTLESSVNACFTVLPGGGSTIKGIFDRRKAGILPTLCMLDSDKVHPKGPIGSTAKMFQKPDFDSISNICRAHIIDAHELECLVPIQAIHDMLHSPTSTYSQIEKNKVFKLVDVADSDFRRWFDHKTGLTLSVATTYDQEYGQQYWRNLFTEQYQTDDENFSVQGFGNGLLSNIVNYLNSMNIRHYRGKMEPFIATEWEVLGKILFSWGCISSQRLSRS